jgi:hypothetical protein
MDGTPVTIKPRAIIEAVLVGLLSWMAYTTQQLSITTAKHEERLIFIQAQLATVNSRLRDASAR